MIDTIKLVELHDARFAPVLDAQSALNFRLLAQELDADHKMADVRWRAYALATVRRECGGDYAPKSERGGVEYCAKYEPGTERGRSLGNQYAGDGYLFRGRGYVQLTGRANYAKFAAILNRDLIGAPDQALQHDLAYQILSFGMTRGLFTGVGLSRFIHGENCDYINARKIINGLDHAEEIAIHAATFEGILRECALPGVVVNT